MAQIELTVRYCRLAADPGTPQDERNLERREMGWNLPTEETALVLVDCWQDHYLKAHVVRTTQVIRERIQPVVESCRAAGVAVIHAPCRDTATHYPQWVRYADDEDLFGRPPTPEPEWPPEDFRKRTGDYERFAKPPEPVIKEYYKKDHAKRRIIEDLLPAPDDLVIATGDQLHRLLRHRKILHLLYAGFEANMCMMMRDYGMRAMNTRGYNIILLRDCTAAIECQDTIAEERLLEAAILETEMLLGHTTTSEELIRACGEPS